MEFFEDLLNDFKAINKETIYQVYFKKLYEHSIFIEELILKSHKDILRAITDAKDGVLAINKQASVEEIDSVKKNYNLVHNFCEDKNVLSQRATMLYWALINIPKELNISNGKTDQVGNLKIVINEAINAIITGEWTITKYPDSHHSYGIMICSYFHQVLQQNTWSISTLKATKKIVSAN